MKEVFSNGAERGRGEHETELSRRFGVSRRTIHEWIETGQVDRDLEGGGTRYSPRPAVEHKLDGYKGIIAAAKPA
ncbi:MAG: hypothetical protein OXE53_12690 [Deltaproteobacteria bacterium]|nr:hypothetical protein [Deltaproteobacteria bacterium]